MGGSSIFWRRTSPPIPTCNLEPLSAPSTKPAASSLDHYVKLEPILNSEEDQPVTVPAGFDPAAIKLIGNVVGAPPVRGVLRHKGWRVKEVNLPPLPQGDGRMVIAPAEVELS